MTTILIVTSFSILIVGIVLLAFFVLSNQTPLPNQKSTTNLQAQNTTTTTTITPTTTTSKTKGGTGKQSGWFCIQLPKSWSVEALPMKNENNTYYCEANAPNDGCNHHTSTTKEECDNWLKTHQDIKAFAVPGGLNDHRVKTAHLMINDGKCAPYCDQIKNETIQSIYEKY